MVRDLYHTTVSIMGGEAVDSGGKYRAENTLSEMT